MLKSAGNSPAFAHVYVVILAGGSGTRFWPLSRQRHPKQLLELFGRGTLLEQTAARIRHVIPPERTYIFTNETVRDEVARLLPRIPKDQIVAEPAPRNTAPTVGLAAHEILRRDTDGVMVVLPSDHVITRPAAFKRVLKAGCRFASMEGRSVTIGLRPTRPETGYGYVRLGRRMKRVDGQEIFAVRKFTEKPPAATAARYVASGEYLWNGGMFIWRASTLIRNLERFQPRMAAGLRRIAEAGGARARESFKRLYPRLQKISIDYALMEQIPQVYAVAANIGWSDVGSWAVAHDLNPKDANRNVRPRRSLSLDSRANMVVSSKFVVTVGVQNLVIVETDDALLVCQLGRSQDVGKAVQEMERRGLKALL